MASSSMDKGLTEDRSVSIIIPCYNEEAVIKGKIKNCMELSYGHPLEIIVIDDFSTDGTFEAARQCPGNPYPLTVVKNVYRKGKTGAIRTAAELAKGKLLCITDADNFFESDMLTNSVIPFDDPNVGIVTGLRRVVRRSSRDGATEFVPKFSLYHAVRNLTIRFYSWLDSTPCVHGSFMIFRKDIGILPRDGIRADDCDLGIQIRKKGFRCISSGTYFLSPELESSDERNKQWYRQSLGNIQCFFDVHRDALFNPKLGLFGLFIYPLEMSFFLHPFILGLSLLGVFTYLSYKEFYLGITFMLGLGVAALLIKPIRDYFHKNYILGKATWDFYMKPDTSITDSWITPKRPG